LLSQLARRLEESDMLDTWEGPHDAGAVPTSGATGASAWRFVDDPFAADAPSFYPMLRYLSDSLMLDPTGNVPRSPSSPVPLSLLLPASASSPPPSPLHRTRSTSSAAAAAATASDSAVANDLIALHTLYRRLGQFRITHREDRFAPDEEDGGTATDSIASTLPDAAAAFTAAVPTPTADTVDSASPMVQEADAALLLLTPSSSAEGSQPESSSTSVSLVGVECGAALAGSRPCSAPSPCVHYPLPPADLDDVAVVSNGWDDEGEYALAPSEAQGTNGRNSSNSSHSDSADGGVDSADAVRHLHVNAAATRLLGVSNAQARRMFRLHGISRVIEVAHRRDWQEAVYAFTMRNYAEGIDEFCVHSVIPRYVDGQPSDSQFLYAHMRVQHQQGDNWTKWKCTYLEIPGPLPPVLSRLRTVDEVRDGASEF